ncbi:hypothetical protein [Salipaludibacillus daqingensis]|uniref:hypothetical protein n=1 Tax=Salipaludibacillus daqingensis TaxID=3041001 RepID=UPI00247310DA|nr:hypothetical protein [Salipaludibacillus daqingensis]
MLDTLQTAFTVCVQRNPDDTYTFAGLVNAEDVSEGTVVELNVKEPSGFFSKMVSACLDEFRYFEMEHIQITKENFADLYFFLPDQNIMEKVEFTEE